jgi:tetratricopeptide (TPR) repeat protein
VANNLAMLYWDRGDYDRAWDGLEQSLVICREIGDRSGEGVVLCNLSYLAHLKRDPEGALDYGRQALAITEELGERDTQADIWNTMGLAHAALGHFTEAEDLHQRALSQRRELGLVPQAMDTLAGLADLHLVQGDLAGAGAHVEEILGYLAAGHSLEGTAEPIWIYLTCYRVLQANQDPRAPDILRTGRDTLLERAAKFKDEETQRSYLENVAAHREILSAWQAAS